MGREQELRDAAKDGNVPKLESLLAAKKGSIMSRYKLSRFNSYKDFIMLMCLFNVFHKCKSHVLWLPLWRKPKLGYKEGISTNRTNQ